MNNLFFLNTILLGGPTSAKVAAAHAAGFDQIELWRQDVEAVPGGAVAVGRLLSDNSSVADSVDEAPSDIVTLGSHVLLEDLDDSTREEYTLVLSLESNPAEGRLSNESPVGRAIVGHHASEVVDALAPSRKRRLRIASVSRGRAPASAADC